MNQLSEPSTLAYVINGIVTTVLGLVLGWVIERLKESSKEKFDSLLKSINRIETQQEKFEDKMYNKIVSLEEKINEIGDLATQIQESVKAGREVRDVVNRQLHSRVNIIEKEIKEFGKVIRKP